MSKNKNTRKLCQIFLENSVSCKLVAYFESPFLCFVLRMIFYNRSIIFLHIFFNDILRHKFPTPSVVNLAHFVCYTSSGRFYPLLPVIWHGILFNVYKCDNGFKNCCRIS